MGRNLKFFGIIVLLLAVSLGALAGGMQLIKIKGSEEKDLEVKEDADLLWNEANREKYFQSSTQIQMYEEMQKRHFDMEAVSEDGKTITVITDTSLKKYWEMKERTYIIRPDGTSLTPKGWSISADEVLFLIQESGRIFRNYETIILPEDSERLGWLSGAVIKPKDWLMYTDSGNVYVDEYIGVYYLTYARVKALSSPEAFISGKQKDRLLKEGYYSQNMDGEEYGDFAYSVNRECFEYYITDYVLNSYYSETNDVNEIKKRDNLTTLFWFNPDFFMKSSIIMENEHRGVTSVHNDMAETVLTEAQKAAMEEITEREKASQTGLLAFEKAVVRGDMDEHFVRMSIEEVQSIITSKKNFNDIVRALIYRQPYPDLGNGSKELRSIYNLDDGKSMIIISEYPEKAVIYREIQPDGTYTDTVLFVDGQ